MYRHYIFSLDYIQRSAVDDWDRPGTVRQTLTIFRFAPYWATWRGKVVTPISFKRQAPARGDPLRRFGNACQI